MGTDGKAVVKSLSKLMERIPHRTNIALLAKMLIGSEAG
jgi:hypothetical protein